MNYIVRIQLNTVAGVSPGAHIYAALHEKMDDVGAARTVFGFAQGHAEEYQLPHGMYEIESGMGAVEVRDAIDLIVAAVWSNFELLVADWDNMAFKLKPVVKAPPSRAAALLGNFR